MARGSPKKRTEHEEWFSDVRREDIGYKFIVNAQINAIVRAYTGLEDPLSVEIFANAVRGLENLLWAYCITNQEYQDRVTEIEAIKPRDLSQLINSKDSLYKMYNYQVAGVKQDEEIKVTIYKETARWRALMKLAHRIGLLLERQTYEEIGKK